MGANVPGAASPDDLDTSMIPETPPNPENVSPRSNSRVYAASQRGLNDFITKAVDTVTSLNVFHADKSRRIKPLEVDVKFNLIDKTIGCSEEFGNFTSVNPRVGVSGNVKVDVEVKARAVMNIGVAACGTIIPPRVDNFRITSSEYH